MNKKNIAIFSIVLLSIYLGYLYTQTVVLAPNEKFRQLRKMVYFKGNIMRIGFDVSSDAYLLRIKHVIKPSQEKIVMINGIQIGANCLHHIRKRGIIETNYKYLPYGMIKDGNNLLEIRFIHTSPEDVELFLTNYRLNIDGNIYVLFKDSRHLPYMHFNPTIFTLVSLGFFIFLWLIVCSLRKITVLGLGRLCLYQLYALLPFISFLSLLLAWDRFSKIYPIVITSDFFWKSCLMSFIMMQMIILLVKAHFFKVRHLRSYFPKAHLFKVRHLRSYFPKAHPFYNNRETNYLNPVASAVVSLILSRFNECDYADKYFIIFSSLLVFSGCLLCFFSTWNLFVDFFVSVAFLFLMAGVGIKFINFLKEPKA